MKLTEDEKTELIYAIREIEDQYQKYLKNLLEIEDEEDVKRQIFYWETCIKNVRTLKEKITDKMRKGEL